MRRWLPALSFLLTLVPTAAWADEATEASTTNIPLVIAGIVVGLVGAALLFRGLGRPWMGWTVVGLGVVALALGFIVPRLGGGIDASDVSVSIVRPDAGQQLPAGKPVKVRVDLEGAQIATSPTDHTGGHLHLYVDGELQQMPYSKTAEVTLRRGPHVLKVEYVDHEHISFDPEIAATVRVRAG